MSRHKNLQFTYKIIFINNKIVKESQDCLFSTSLDVKAGGLFFFCQLSYLKEEEQYELHTIMVLEEEKPYPREQPEQSKINEWR